MDWQNISVATETPIIEALRIIDSGSVQICLVVDAQNRLLGTVTDGDIRRGILAGCSLGASVGDIMNAKPIVASAGQSSEEIAECMRSEQILQLPVVDKTGKVIAVRFLKDLLNSDEQSNPVVLMAGGLGTRLRPLTNNCPKPMLQVGGRPILEGIIRRFASGGFKRFYITVHYKAEVIKEYFGDGAKFGVQIEYIEEEVALGTAGALTLLPETPDKPFFVMNADLLTTINFKQLLAFHKKQEVAATMCVQTHQVEIPFGVIEADGNTINRIDEKPVKGFLVNAGIYVIEPSILKLLDKKVHTSMPELFKLVIETGQKASAFAMHEDWLDIGRPEDFEKADEFLAATERA